ncbi:MAG: hypothetical protein J1F66_00200 [Clostridiales bacterium]|nr:hypothetical protein [Clostridiales bacterium]
MKRYFALVKLLFTQQYKLRPKSDERSSKKKRVGTVIALIALALCFAPTVISIAVAIYYLGRLSEGNVYVAGFLALMCQGLVLMFGLHTVISNVFVVKDADKLLYLPVRVHTIFLAKLTVAYLNEVITTAFVSLILLLPFGIGAGASFGYYLMLLVAIATIPILPLFVGCILAMPFSALIARLGKSSAVKTILRIGLYVLIMAVYMYAMYSFGFYTSTPNGNLMDDPELFISNILNDFVARLQSFVPYLHPNYMLVSSMLAKTFIGWLGYFAAAIGECTALFAIIALVSLPFYRRMLSTSTEGYGATRHKAKPEQFRASNKGVVKELILTDFKRVARDGQLGFQSFAGIVMLPLIVLIFYFIMGQSTAEEASFLEFVAVDPLYQVVAPLIILAYMTLLGAGTNVLGLYPISRENKTISMLKSIPVPFSKILLAKVLFATAVMLTCDTLTCLLIVLLLGVKWYCGIAMLITMALVCFGAMCVTTLLDLKDPKFGWTNFNQSLKNAKNSWLAMLIGLLATVGVAVVAVWFVIWYVVMPAWYVMLLMWLCIFALAVGFAVVAYKVMVGKSQKYFDQIEA